MTCKVTLRGLQTRPLASYFAALGVLQIATRRRSSQILGAFGPRGFEVVGIKAPDLIELLLDEWEPSPVLTPWNNASGFYDSSKGRLAAEAMNRVTSSTLSRLGNLTKAIVSVRKLIASLGYGDAPEGEEKAHFIERLRNTLSDDAVAWIDAVAAIDETDARMMPLLGSGGNEGVLDYSGLFLRSVCDTILGDRARSKRLLEAALFGATTQDLVESPAGQFEPGTAGGFNTGPGFESKGLPNNPWVFVLLIEGTLTWASGLASRQEGSATGYRFAVSPFTVRHRAAGYGSASNGDDDPQRVRAELWLPLWERPASLRELARFIAEGRVDVVGRKDKIGRASDSMDFVDAVALLGVDRGVSEFLRYVLIKRRGESYIALPAGSVTVGYRPQAELLRGLDRELDLVDQFFSRFPSQEGAPAVLQGLRRAIDDARYVAATRGGEQAMRLVVRAIGALELALSRRDPGKEPKLLRPLGGLGPDWISACGDSTVVRLAAGLASIRETGGSAGIRAYLAPLDPSDTRNYASGQRALGWFGMSVTDRIANVLHRRLLDARATAGSDDIANPTLGHCPVPLEDVAAFLSTELFENRELRELEELMFGFSWIDFQGFQQSGDAVRFPVECRVLLPRCYALLKLLFLPTPLQNRGDAGEPLTILADASIIPLLRAGRVSDAVEVASRRLMSKGLRPRMVVVDGINEPQFGRRLAAALLLPIRDIGKLMGLALLTPADRPEDRILPKNEETTDAQELSC